MGKESTLKIAYKATSQREVLEVTPTQSLLHPGNVPQGPLMQRQGENPKISDFPSLPRSGACLMTAFGPMGS